MCNWTGAKREGKAEKENKRNPNKCLFAHWDEAINEFLFRLLQRTVRAPLWLNHFLCEMWNCENGRVGTWKQLLYYAAQAIVASQDGARKPSANQTETLTLITLNIFRAQTKWGHFHSDSQNICARFNES